LAEDTKKKELLICINQRYSLDKPCCALRGGVEIADELEKRIEAHGLDIKTERINCLGQCQKGPVARIAPGGKFFFGMKIDSLDEMIGDLKEEFNEKEKA